MAINNLQFKGWHRLYKGSRPYIYRKLKAHVMTNELTPELCSWLGKTRMAWYTWSLIHFLNAGKIQQLKHTTPKGDKKRKKELQVQISQLEAELQKKHEAELQSLKEEVLVNISILCLILTA